MRDVLAVFSSESGWMKLALCARSTNPDWWFPGMGGSTTLSKEVCAECAVREECLDYAIVNKIDLGIWGGAGPKERRMIARSRMREADPGRAV